MGRVFKNPQVSAGLVASARGTLAAAIAVALIAVAGGCGGSGSANVGSDGAGESSAPSLSDVSLAPVGDAPAFTLGEPTELPTVVNLWATWCPPCRKELPDFERVSKERAGEVQFVGVNVGEDADAAQNFIDDVGVTFPQYVDGDSLVPETLDVKGMPSTIFFNADGSINEVYSGALTKAELEKRVDALK